MIWPCSLLTSSNRTGQEVGLSPYRLIWLELPGREPGCRLVAHEVPWTWPVIVDQDGSRPWCLNPQAMLLAAPAKVQMVWGHLVSTRWLWHLGKMAPTATFGLIHILALFSTVRWYHSTINLAGWTIVVTVAGVGQKVSRLIIRHGILEVWSDLGKLIMAPMLTPSSLWLRTGAASMVLSAKNGTPGWSSGSCKTDGLR